VLPMIQPMPGPVFGACKAISDLLDRTQGRELSRDETRLMIRYADRLWEAARQAGERAREDSHGHSD